MNLIDRDLFEDAIRRRRATLAQFKTDPTGDRTAELENVLVLCSLYRVEPAEPIRCKDCRNRGNQFGQDHYCHIVSNVMPDDGYCSMAVRREG